MANLMLMRVLYRAWNFAGLSRVCSARGQKRIIVTGRISMKFACLMVVCASLALAACRREEATYVPMKLGGDVQSPSTAR
jgi:hypothetical protein